MSQRDWDDSEQENDDKPEEPQPPLDADAASPEDLDESGETLHPEDWDPANDAADEKPTRRSAFVEMPRDAAIVLGMLHCWLCRRLSPIRKLPTPLLALLLILPALVIGFANPWGRWWKYVGIVSGAVAFFLPGAVKRGKWRHVLWMLLFLLAALCLSEGWKILHVELRFPYGWLTAVFLPLPAAIGEWFLTGRTRGKVLSYVAAAIAAGLTYDFANLVLAWRTESAFHSCPR
jgi:hypothetical protein